MGFMALSRAQCNKIGRAMIHIDKVSELNESIERLNAKIRKLANERDHHQKSAINLFNKSKIDWWKKIR